MTVNIVMAYIPINAAAAHTSRTTSSSTSAPRRSHDQVMDVAHATSRRLAIRVETAIGVVRVVGSTSCAQWRVAEVVARADRSECRGRPAGCHVSAACDGDHRGHRQQQRCGDRPVEGDGDGDERGRRGVRRPDLAHGAGHVRQPLAADDQREHHRGENGGHQRGRHPTGDRRDRQHRHRSRRRAAARSRPDGYCAAAGSEHP